MFRPAREHHEYPLIMYSIGASLIGGFLSSLFPTVEFVFTVALGFLLGIAVTWIVQYYWNEHKKMQHVLTAPVEQLRQEEEREGIK